MGITMTGIPKRPAPDAPDYVYRAVVLEVIDGDSIWLSVDQGLEEWAHKNVRLAHINAPEEVGANRAAGLAARVALQSILPDGAHVRIQTYKDRTEKYGRYLADIWTSDGIYVNGWMVDAGFAVPYEGGKRS